MESPKEVKVGQVYRCKRRNHTLKVKAIAFNLAAVCESSSGKSVSVSLKRLLAPYRFELIEERAAISEPAEEAVTHA